MAGAVNQVGKLSGEERRAPDPPLVCRMRAKRQGAPQQECEPPPTTQPHMGAERPVRRLVRCARAPEAKEPLEGEQCNPAGVRGKRTAHASVTR
ncbi:hypothetical protein NDU88_006149 [Pleurodeles waltl]|uniref:Uncharacterized protein n=1 Tax=Pleurodeles waltl TaxID=8319 RepID=A0AAV7LR46_PLEWA|nr:hypothetical protein NDU88_006149 [Pleurodeles waltl]